MMEAGSIGSDPLSRTRTDHPRRDDMPNLAPVDLHKRQLSSTTLPSSTNLAHDGDELIQLVPVQLAVLEDVGRDNHVRCPGVEVLLGIVRVDPPAHLCEGGRVIVQLERRNGLCSVVVSKRGACGRKRGGVCGWGRRVGGLRSPPG